jgi:predicted DNA-binding WGR domain protein
MAKKVNKAKRPKDKYYQLAKEQASVVAQCGRVPLAGLALTWLHPTWR